MAELQHVFKTSGVPDVTFVKPVEYPTILLNLKTPGRGLVVEGPSGIGKTTAVLKAIEELGVSHKVTKLSARDPDDLEYINIIPSTRNFGVVLVDDFHKLDQKLQNQIADELKLLADAGRPDAKLIILGISEAGQSLIEFAPDLVNRIDIIKFENSTDEKVEELITKGEKELNISINIKEDIVQEASGGFYIAQMICSEICKQADVLETKENYTPVRASIESVKTTIWNRLSLTFYKVCKDFALGARYRPEGRAPYLHLLTWLAHSGAWSLNIRDAMRNNPDMSLSVGQVVEKGYLNDLFQRNPGLSKVLHFDDRNLVVEDPQFIFFIRNMPWARFATELGFKNIEFKSRYDFALSFAGADRDVAELLFHALEDEELSVFYDRNEQYRLIAVDLEEYLGPIYQSEARFVICIIGPSYPKRIWTAFEAKMFAKRIGSEVIPVVVDQTPIDAFSSLSKVGHLSFSRQEDAKTQIHNLVSALLRKISDS